MDELAATPFPPRSDPREEIARIEDEIEELEAQLETCRKFAAASRFAMALGGAILIGILVGVLPFDPLTMIGGMVAAIGGVVMLGSNKATAEQASAALAAAQGARARLIGTIELRVVGGSDTVH